MGDDIVCSIRRRVELSRNGLTLESKISRVTKKVEILLPNKGFCNLVEIDVAKFKGDDYGLKEAIRIMARANYRQTCVDFRDGILQEAWHLNNSFLRLCGVGLTGLNQRQDFTEYDLKALNRAAWSGACGMADEFGTPHPKNTTCVKPSGCRLYHDVITTSKGILLMSEVMETHPNGQEWADVPDNLQAAQGSYVSNKITKTYDNGVAEVFEIKLNYGLTLYSTGNHPWFVDRLVDSNNYQKAKKREIHDFIETKDLVPGHVISCNVGIYTNSIHKELKPVQQTYRTVAKVINQPSVMSEDLAWLLGYLWGDGCMSQPGDKPRVRWMDGHYYNLEKAQRVLKEVFGIDTVIHKASQGRNAWVIEVGSVILWDWLRENNIWKYSESGLAFIPRVIRESSQSDIIAFIAGLLDSDGCVSISSTGKRSPMLSSSDKLFCEHLQHVAWAVGIPFSLSHNTKGTNLQAVKSMYRMTLTPHTTDEAFNLLLKNSNKMTREDRGSVWCCDLTASNVGLTGRVLSVKSVGFKPTCDVSVENEPWYYAGAVKSHNSISKIMDTTEGIHKPLGKYMFNNINFGNTNPIVQKAIDAGYRVFPNPDSPENTLITMPVCWDNVEFDKVVKEEGSVVEVNLDSAVKQLERYKFIQTNWTDQNTSNTISYSPDEVPEIIDWLLANWDCYVGVSFLYRNDPSKTAQDLGYQYLPQEVVTKEVYEEYVKQLKPLVLDEDEETVLEGLDDSECAGGACPIR